MERTRAGVASLELELLDARVRIRSRDSALIDDVSRCFEGRTETEGPGWDLDVMVEPDPTVGGTRRGLELRTSPAGAFEGLGAIAPRGAGDLCSLLNNWAAKRDSAYYVFHAGAVASGGSALLLPGGSYSGKSTLTAGLLQRGFGFLSDEVGAVDRRTWRLCSYPRKLSLRPNVLRFLGLGEDVGHGLSGEASRMLAPREVGGARASGRSELSMIIAPRLGGNGATTLRALSPGQAVLKLVESSCSLSNLKVAGLDWLIETAKRTPVFSLEYSDLQSALDSIERTWREDRE